MSRALDITNMRSGMLTAIKLSDKDDGYGHKYWICECDCGNVCYVVPTKIKDQSTRSCGCDRLNHHHKTHGMTKTRIYKTWQDMKARCYRKNNKDYMRYGGRGITICNDWMKFEPFMKWAYENGYTDNLELDRIDYDGNYEPSNCRFATRREQTNNTCRNHYITINGVTRTMSEWGDLAGVSYTTIRARINKLHWNPEDAIFSGRRNWHRRTGD